jgi:hypothetical protein
MYVSDLPIDFLFFIFVWKGRFFFHFISPMLLLEISYTEHAFSGESFCKEFSKINYNGSFYS